MRWCLCLLLLSNYSLFSCCSKQWRTHTHAQSERRRVMIAKLNADKNLCCVSRSRFFSQSFVNSTFTFIVSFRRKFQFNLFVLGSTLLPQHSHKQTHTHIWTKSEKLLNSFSRSRDTIFSATSFCCTANSVFLLQLQKELAGFIWPRLKLLLFAYLRLQFYVYFLRNAINAN